MLLETAITKPTPSPPKGIIYGPPGIGKTTFGAMATKSIILDCENGAGNVRSPWPEITIECKRTPYLQSWPEIKAWLTELETAKHDYRTVVIDSIDWLLRAIEVHVSGSTHQLDQTINRSHGGYGNGKQVFKNYVWQDLLQQLDRLIVRGMAVILLAHAKRVEITDVDGITTEKVSADLPEGYLNIFVEWSDFVCLAKAAPDGKRILVTQETHRALAKNRYGMPPELPFDWPSFQTAIASRIKQGGKV